jgi:hypothetical protein
MSEKESLTGQNLFFDGENDLTLSYEKIIPLESSDDCLIGTIEQLEIVGDKIFILDAFVNRKLYVFDLQGRFITNIGARGQGGEEYNFPGGFAIHLKENTISILDPTQRAIIRYDLDSYEFVSKKTIPFDFSDAGVLEDGKYVFLNDAQDINGENVYHYTISDSAFTIENQFIPIEFNARHTTPPYRNIYMLNGETYGFIRLRNTIYEIHSDHITPTYTLSFKEHSFPPLDRLIKEEATAFNRNYLPWLSDSGYIYFYNIIENDTLLCVDYMVNKERYWGFYNKESKQKHLCSLKRFQEISGLCGMEQIGGRSDENCLVAVSYPYKMINQIRHNEFYSDKSKEIAEHLNPDDNPVLFLFKIN